MSPYLTAFHKYQEIERGVSWTDALDFHFQHGVVISTPEVFVLARRVSIYWSDEEQVSLFQPLDLKFSEKWQVWAVAGDLGKLLALAKEHHVRLVTYQRHGCQKLRQRWIHDLARRV